MAEFNKGLVQQAKKGVNRTISTTVTGLAETALGDINYWRDVLTNNPEKLPFSLPPTLQQDIDNLNAQIPFPGLKIPPLNVLETDLKKALGSLAKPVLLDVDSKVAPLLGQAAKEIDRLKQIDWLI